MLRCGEEPVAVVGEHVEGARRMAVEGVGWAGGEDGIVPDGGEDLE